MNIMMVGTTWHSVAQGSWTFTPEEGYTNTNRLIYASQADPILPSFYQVQRREAHGIY